MFGIINNLFSKKLIVQQECIKLIKSDSKEYYHSFQKIWSSATVLNNDNNKMFIEHNISILEWSIMWHWILE